MNFLSEYHQSISKHIKKNNLKTLVSASIVKHEINKDSYVFKKAKLQESLKNLTIVSAQLEAVTKRISNKWL